DVDLGVPPVAVLPPASRPELALLNREVAAAVTVAAGGQPDDLLSRTCEPPVVVHDAPIALTEIEPCELPAPISAPALALQAVPIAIDGQLATALGVGAGRERAPILRAIATGRAPEGAAVRGVVSSAASLVGGGGTVAVRHRKDAAREEHRG